MPRKQVSDQEFSILDFIDKYTREVGLPPLYKEITKHMKWPLHTAVSPRVSRLAKRGFLSRTGEWRGVFLTDAARAILAKDREAMASQLDIEDCITASLVRAREMARA